MARRFKAQKKRSSRISKPNTPVRTRASEATPSKPAAAAAVPVYSMTTPSPSRPSPATAQVETARYENLSRELRRVFIITAIILVILFILWAVLR